MGCKFFFQEGKYYILQPVTYFVLLYCYIDICYNVYAFDVFSVSDENIL